MNGKVVLILFLTCLIDTTDAKYETAIETQRSNFNIQSRHSIESNDVLKQTKTIRRRLQKKKFVDDVVKSITDELCNGIEKGKNDKKKVRIDKHEKIDKVYRTNSGKRKLKEDKTKLRTTPISKGQQVLDEVLPSATDIKIKELKSTELRRLRRILCEEESAEIEPGDFQEDGFSLIPSQQPSWRPSLNFKTSTSVPQTTTPLVSPPNMVTSVPTLKPTSIPTVKPTEKPALTAADVELIVRNITGPTRIPTFIPTQRPAQPTFKPTSKPSLGPLQPTGIPIKNVTLTPTSAPKLVPTNNPNVKPTLAPTSAPNLEPATSPNIEPTRKPQLESTDEPAAEPSRNPVPEPSRKPRGKPKRKPSRKPSRKPGGKPTRKPSTSKPNPIQTPSLSPSSSAQPSDIPSLSPSEVNEGERPVRE